MTRIRLYVKYNSTLLIYKFLKCFKFYRLNVCRKVKDCGEYKNCSIAGRVEIANILVEEGLIKDSDEYVRFLNDN